MPRIEKNQLLATRGPAIGMIAVLLGLVMIGCNSRRHEDRVESDPVPSVVTADIQAGIEKHIEDQARLGDGYFQLPYEGKVLRLKLVRIHTEYLANLGPRQHFACIDLAEEGGDVYDVDFFLSGDPGSMTVTETIPHKINGKPFYFWKQNEDKTWGRVPVTDAARELMGVILPDDAFEFRYALTLPELTGPSRLWLPLPITDAFQTVKVGTIDAPAKHRVLEEATHGNKVLFWELDSSHSGKTIDIRYNVQRIEKSAYADDSGDVSKYLLAERLVPDDKSFNDIAQDVVEGKKGDLVRARALYDHVIERMRYIKYGDGWGKGDAVYACNARTGNCTDYHAYFIGLARAVGIPARFAIGAAVPSERDEGGVDGYHCWVEFHAEGKWWPVDISEADKYSALSSYYFGHHPANRLEFSRGRDLVVEPGPKSGPMNFLAYPVLEIEGKPAKAAVQFSFRREKD
ncbi:MAG: transglutaminase domain-containing protein [Lentisphaerales bacterium]|nr:MAG: transglutaminase domain-containing protein [Lentisphaerales bacterium]